MKRLITADSAPVPSTESWLYVIAIFGLLPLSSRTTNCKPAIFYFEGTYGAR